MFEHVWLIIFVQTGTTDEHDEMLIPFTIFESIVLQFLVSNFLF